MKLKTLLKELSYSNSIRVDISDYFTVTFVDIHLFVNCDIYGNAMNTISDLINKYGERDVIRFSNINDAAYTITIAN